MNGGASALLPFTGIDGVRTDRGRNPDIANLRPAPAATMMIVDRTGAEPRVLIGRRHQGHVFMPGRFVFPGGRVEAGDRQMNVAGALNEWMEQRLMRQVTRPAAIRPRALALAAIRETFEETGLMIGSKDYGPLPASPQGTWSEFAARDVFPELDRLHLIARAITPPRRNKRFDTAFFAVDSDAICEKVEGVVGPDSELVELVWLPVGEAASLDMPLITRAVLADLAARLEAGMSPMLPVPLYRDRGGAWRREEL
ncbi:MAG: NUDIX hydrolase [Beijerinckiaceae bacterium]|nr:NUDIX hydrolase [Beijerinckiaceae bacterium]